MNDLRAWRDLLRRGYLWYSHRGLTSTLERMTGMLGDRRAPSARSYTSWLEGQRADPASGAAPPLLVSVLVPVHDPPVALLAELHASVRGQSHAAWQLLLCDDGCRDAAVLALLARLSADDPRVTLLATPPGARGISAATNAAAAAARGEAFVLLDHDDVLAAGVLAAVASAFAGDDRLELLYTDEDQLASWGERVSPVFKPGPSPVLLLGFNYVTHLLALRRSLWERLGGLRADFDGAQDHDLALRGFESAARIAHLPRIGYHWRRSRGSVADSSTAKPWAYEAGRRAVEQACARRGLPVGAVTHGAVPGVYVLAPEAPEAARRCHVVLRGPERGCAAWTAALSAPDAPARAISLSRNRWPATGRDDRASWLVIDATLQARGDALALLLAWAALPGAGGAAACAVEGRRRRDAGWSLSGSGRARPMLPGLPAHAAGPGLLASSTREVAAACGGLLCVHDPPWEVRAALSGLPSSDADELCLSLAAHRPGAALLFVPGCRPRVERLRSGAGSARAAVDLAASAAWPLARAALPADFWRAGSDRFCPRHELLVPLGLPAPEAQSTGSTA
ncbi:MAG TPA: glycosyltransferase [Planctomycetota bacterium]|nr:glycosyltransferase [Planctomycetota bacterium]